MPADVMVDTVRSKLERCRGHWPAVMRKARVSRSWLTQFAAGRVSDPRLNTILSVSRACDEVIALIDQLRAS